MNEADRILAEFCRDLEANPGQEIPVIEQHVLEEFLRYPGKDYILPSPLGTGDKPRISTVRADRFRRDKGAACPFQPPEFYWPTGMMHARLNCLPRGRPPKRIEMKTETATTPKRSRRVTRQSQKDLEKATREQEKKEREEEELEEFSRSLDKNREFNFNVRPDLIMKWLLAKDREEEAAALQENSHRSFLESYPAIATVGAEVEVESTPLE